MNLQELLQARAAKHDRNGAILAEMVKTDPALTEARATLEAEFDKNEAEMKALDAQIARVEAHASRTGVVDGKPNDPGWKAPAEPKDHSKDQPYATLAEQIYDVIQAGRPGGVVSERLMRVQATATGGSSGVPSEGGFLVQPTLVPGLIQTSIEEDEILSKCTSVEVGENSDSAKVVMVKDRNRGTGWRWGGVRVYRRAEADTVTAFKADDFATWECQLEDIMALSYLTERQMQDIPQLASLIRNSVPKEIAFTLTEEMFTGNGVGHMLGILKAGSLVTVPIETGQTVADKPVLAENISNMWARVPKENRRNAIWLYNQELEPHFDSLNMHVGTGGQLVYMPAGGLSGVGYGSFKGRPALPFEHCEAPGTLGDFMVVDPSDFVLVRKGQAQEAESIHVRFIYAERCLRWILRINGKPKFTEKIVPYKGTKERSSFVALAAR